MEERLLLPFQTKILIVDDDLRNLLAFEAILEDLGHEVMTARSGKEALELTAKHDFALILLDIMMPGIDGFETAALVHKQADVGDLKYTPILIMTGLASEE